MDYDIVMPVTTFLEHTDLGTPHTGDHHLQLARPALPSPGKTKSNVEVSPAGARNGIFRLVLR